MSDRTIPEPPVGMRYVTGSLPTPPEEGWWLDPDDPAVMRYHTGDHWTDQTASSMQRLKGVKRISAEKKPLRAYFQKGELSTTLLILASIALAVAAILIPWVAPAFGRGSLAYQWTNRIGIVILYLVLIPNALIDIYFAFRGTLEQALTTGMRIALPFIGLVPLILFTVILWNRILEAVWLR